MLKRNILFVCEYWKTSDFKTEIEPDFGNYFVAEETIPLLSFALNNFNKVGLIHPITEKFSDRSEFNYLDIKTAQINHSNLLSNEFTDLYFPLMAKKVCKSDMSNDLTTNLPNFCEFLESLIPYTNTIHCINNPQTIVNTISKNYIFELSKKGVDFFIPTFDIHNLNEISTILNCNKKKKYVIKPKISERANFATIIDSKIWTNSDIQKTYASFLNMQNKEIDKNKLYNKIMSSQGLVLQEYQNGFINSGEIKVAVVNGEIVNARKTIPSCPSKIPYIAANCGEFIKYNLSNLEKDFVIDVHEAFTKVFPSEAIRIDYIQNKEGVFLVSEIEAINQSYATRLDSLYTDQEREILFKKILSV
jgi:hypothetical protein